MLRTASLIASLAVMMIGCGLNPPLTDKLASPEKVAADVGLAVESVKHLYRCNVAQANPSEKSAHFVYCLYIPQTNGAVIVGFDVDLNRYIELLRLDARTVHGVALKVMGNAKQFQLYTESYGLVVFYLLSDDRAWTNSLATTAAFEHLRTSQIAVVEPIQYIHTYRKVNVRWTFR